MLATETTPHQPTTMTAYDRLKALNEVFTACRADNNSPTALDCLIHIADGEGNATDTLGWDARHTEEWCSLAIRSIECQLEVAESHVIAAFNNLGYFH